MGTVLQYLPFGSLAAAPLSLCAGLAGAGHTISSTVIDLQGNLSQYPLSGMPLKLQISLLSVFPAGLLGWFPSLALLGKLPFGLPFFFPALMAVLLFLLSQFVFRKGMKHYVKSGSNRYLSRGFRR